MRRAGEALYLGISLSMALMAASSGCVVDEHDGSDEIGATAGAAGLDEAAGLAQPVSGLTAETCNICPGNMTSYRGQNGFQLTCYCPNAGSGYVWGTDVYTDDSSLCRAALHAGAMSSGVIVATVGPGRTSYVGSTRNGVTSFSYGSYAGSYTVGAGGACVPPILSCPSYLTGYRGSPGTEVICHCSSAATSSGNVWGTGTYTDDSWLCRAAVHAGVITSAGGNIRAVVAPGASSYLGSTQNGVTSYSYGSWPGSYYFQ